MTVPRSFLVAAGAVVFAVAAMAGGYIAGHSSNTNSDGLDAINTNVLSVRAGLDRLVENVTAPELADAPIEPGIVTDRRVGEAVPVAQGEATIEICIDAVLVHGRGTSVVCRTIVTDPATALPSDPKSRTDLECWLRARPLEAVPRCWFGRP